MRPILRVIDDRYLIKHRQYELYIHYHPEMNQYYIGSGIIGAIVFQEINAIGFIRAYLGQAWCAVKIDKLHCAAPLPAQVTHLFDDLDQDISEALQQLK